MPVISPMRRGCAPSHASCCAAFRAWTYASWLKRRFAVAAPVRTTSTSGNCGLSRREESAGGDCHRRRDRGLGQHWLPYPIAHASGEARFFHPAYATRCKCCATRMARLDAPALLLTQNLDAAPLGRGHLLQQRFRAASVFLDERVAAGQFSRRGHSRRSFARNRRIGSSAPLLRRAAALRLSRLRLTLESTVNTSTERVLPFTRRRSTDRRKSPPAPARPWFLRGGDRRGMAWSLPRCGRRD